MSEHVIPWEPRKDLGRRKMRKLREAGSIPAVLYGSEIESTSILCPARDLSRAVNQGAHLVTLKGSDGEHKVLVRDVQYDHLGDAILHVDFHKISLTEKMEIDVPLIINGIPEGVNSEGGVLETPIKELKIRCLPQDIPGRIEIDVSKLKLNDRFRLKEVAAISGVEFIATDELVLAACVEAKEEAPAEPAEAAAATTAEPEVIKKGKEEEGKEGGGESKG